MCFQRPRSHAQYQGKITEWGLEQTQTLLITMGSVALTSVAQPVGHHLTKQKVTSSIPSQDTCLGYGPGAQLGACERQPHIDIFLPLFLLAFPLSKK